MKTSLGLLLVIALLAANAPLALAAAPVDPDTAVSLELAATAFYGAYTWSDGVTTYVQVGGWFQGQPCTPYCVIDAATFGAARQRATDGRGGQTATTSYEIVWVR